MLRTGIAHAVQNDDYPGEVCITQWDIGESGATLLTRVDIPECSCITAVGFAGEDL